MRCHMALFNRQIRKYFEDFEVDLEMLLKCRENVTRRRKVAKRANKIMAVQREGTKEAEQRHHGAKATKTTQTRVKKY